MYVAVAGGTGLVGRMVVERLQRAGHRTTVLTRSNGIDLTTGARLAPALTDVEAVIDVTNAPVTKKAASIEFFQAVTANLLSAEARAGVGHHLALSIVGIDRVPLGYYFGKRAQEELIEAGPVPWTILRATQFHEFAGQVLARMSGPVAVVPRMRTQPIAAAEVAAQLVELVAAEPIGRAADLAGPEVLDLPTMARQLIRRRGCTQRVLPLRLPGRLGRELRGGGLLPSTDGPRGVQPYASWLAAQAG